MVLGRNARRAHLISPRVNKENFARLKSDTWPVPTLEQDSDGFSHSRKPVLRRALYENACCLGCSKARRKKAQEKGQVSSLCSFGLPKSSSTIASQPCRE
jgi:hypothetical protein